MTQNQALKILKSGSNIFLTGEPGSGKTYTVNQYVEYLRSHDIEPAITASTGIAATHIGGLTIHSWSGIGIKNRLSGSDLHNIATNKYIEKRIKGTEVLIIDEVSMLSPDTIDMVDAVCREVRKSHDSFGGVQVVLVGDFFQLPPIVKKTTDEYSQDALFGKSDARFAYDAPAWERAEFVTCYITEQYRQDDHVLVSILSSIRANNFGAESLVHIQKRRMGGIDVPRYVPKLFSHNIDVDIFNDQMLGEISGDPQIFPMVTKGRKALVASMVKGCLSPEVLRLKIGASVMFTKNNPKDRFVNGTLGVVEGFGEETGFPIVRMRNGRKIEVSYMDWKIEEDGKEKGRLTQIPLRLAWAITVHKSQGMSLDEAVIDLSSVFEFGQGYVALSRVRRLSGVHILGWNNMAFQVDPEVVDRDKEFRADSKNAKEMFGRFSEEETKHIQEGFIVSCGGIVNTYDVVSKKKKKEKKPSTYDETLRFWKEGRSVGQIAEIRELSNGTIFSHIENLVKKGEIKPKELDRLITPDLSRSIPEIQSAFQDLDTEKLSIVFKKFDGKYSYDDLRLARMMIK